jgi:hypothetical protein
MHTIITLMDGFANVIRFMMLMRKKAPCFSVWSVRIGSMKSVLGREESLIRTTLTGLCVKGALRRMRGWDGMSRTSRFS